MWYEKGVYKDADKFVLLADNPDNGTMVGGNKDPIAIVISLKEVPRKASRGQANL